MELPLAALTNLTFNQISAGKYHSCGRTVAGKLYCWGYNSSGQLGNGSLNNKKRPTAVTTSLKFTWVSAGPYHTCAIATDSKAYCWGENYYGQPGDGTQVDPYCWGLNSSGQLGDGTTSRRLNPVAVKGGLLFADLRAGGSHTWAVTAGTVVG